VKAEAKLEAYGEITRLAADVNALCAIMRAQDRVLELVPSVVNARQERESSQP
jgi:hypothetical protein